jgi:hypothetical protein
VWDIEPLICNGEYGVDGFEGIRVLSVAPAEAWPTWETDEYMIQATTSYVAWFLSGDGANHE